VLPRSDKRPRSCFSNVDLGGLLLYHVGRRRAYLEWYELDGIKEAWLRYLAAEREALMLRANGLLAYALSGVQPGESKDDLERMASKDERLAREGLLRLLAENGSVSLKHIDDLTPDDVAARRRAETQLLGFLRERTYGHLERSGRRLFPRSRD
jgi:hypothetical protein